MPLDILPYMSLSLINWWLYSRGRLIIGTVAFSFPHHEYGPTSGPQCDERPAIRHAAFPLPTVDRPGAPARRMSNSSTLARLPGCRDSEGIRYGDWSWQWFYKPWRCSFWHLILIINIFFLTWDDALLYFPWYCKGEPFIAQQHRFCTRMTADEISMLQGVTRLGKAAREADAPPQSSWATVHVCFGNTSTVVEFFTSRSEK